MEYKLIVNGEPKPVNVDIIDKDRLSVQLDEATLDVGYTLVSDYRIHLDVDGKGLNVYVLDGPSGKSVYLNGVAYTVQDTDVIQQTTSKRGGGSEMPREITPQTPSVVISVLVKAGDTVNKGQGVVVLSAMKMETTLIAPFNGTVKSVNTNDGDNVAPGDILVDLEEDETPEEESSPE